MRADLTPSLMIEEEEEEVKEGLGKDSEHQSPTGVHDMYAQRLLACVYICMGIPERGNARNYYV